MRYLFIRFSSLGDTVLTTGVLKRFKECVPSATISVLTGEKYREIYERLPFVEKVCSIPSKVSLLKYLRFLKQNREELTTDTLVDWHSNTRSRIASLLIPHKRLLRYDKGALSRRLYASFGITSPSLHTVERYAKVLEGEGLTANSLEELRPWLREKIPAKEGKIVLHPFASRATKEWHHFDNLFFRLKGLETMVVGIGEFPVKKSAHIKTENLTSLMDALADAKLLITTDSGPMHIAVGLGVPTLALFGSTSRELGFYPDFKGCRVLEAELPCRPCHIHGLPACPKKHFDCMNMITIDEVMDAAYSMIKK